MIKNYLRIAIRNVMKLKIYSAITLLGLAVGLGICLFFMRFFIWATHADRFHENSDRIYTMVQVLDAESGEERHTTDIAYPLLPEIKRSIPEIEDATRIYHPGKMVVQRRQELFYENRVMFVDPNFLSFFTFKTISGDPQLALSKPNRIAITRSMALKYFGNESPIGRVLTLNNTFNVTVSAVVENVTEIGYLSTLRFEFLVSLETARRLSGFSERWDDYNQAGFVKLPPA